MKTMNGGSAVRGGYYLSKSNWEIVPVEHDGQLLPGGPQEHYVRVPLPAVLLLMPILGGLMVVFMPFMGLALTAQAAAKPVIGLFRRSAHDLAATVTPGWQPGEAHFTGKRTDDKGAGQAPTKDGKLEELSKEIESKRKS